MPLLPLLPLKPQFIIDSELKFIVMVAGEPFETNIHFIHAHCRGARGVGATRSVRLRLSPTSANGSQRMGACLNNIVQAVGANEICIHFG